jgi:surfactin synthase thioesterase subunit
VCFPHAGAGGATFLPWSRYLPASVGVVGAQLPGRGTRLGEALLRSVEEIVPALASAMRSHEARPFSFFGHSFGAVLAYELARSLRSQNRPGPRAIIVSGCPAPHTEPKRSHMLHALPRDEFFSALHALNGIPAEALENKKLQDLIEPALREDIRCRELWWAAMRARGTPAQPPLSVPIHPMGGRADPFVSEEDLAQWRRYTTDIRPVTLFEGGHFYFKEHPRPVLAKIAAVAAELEPACGKSE